MVSVSPAPGAARGAARLLAVGAVALALTVPADLASADPSPGGAHPTRHSSDGVRGPLLSDASAARTAEAAASQVVEPPQTWAIAPGVTYREWTYTGLRQGNVRLHALVGDLKVPGVSVDYVSGPTVTTRAPFSRLLAAAGGRAGVNADFFDISDTGAPLGVGRDRARGLLNGPASGWNNTVAIAPDGTPTIGQSAVSGEVRRRGKVVAGISGLNDPTLVGDEIGAYTTTWGAAPGRRVTDGAKRVREVVVRGGKVRSNTTKVRSGRAFKGTMLIGRGKGAAALKKLKRGQRVRIDLRAGRPDDQVIVGGSVPLLHGGQLATRDNGELHPRTAFAYSSDTREVILLVADGRSESSGGLTLAQMAEILKGKDFGAEEALNLDGGGSSTMVAPDAAGTVGVRNTPSSGGVERAVPNGLQLRWAW